MESFITSQILESGNIDSIIMFRFHRTVAYTFPSKLADLVDE